MQRQHYSGFAGVGDGKAAPAAAGPLAGNAASLVGHVSEMVAGIGRGGAAVVEHKRGSLRQ